MLTVVTKTSDSGSVTIRISRNGQIVVRKKIERTVTEPVASKNYVAGAGSLFNISGSMSHISIRRASSDSEMLRRDLEKVGQSIYDATLAIIK